jgi:ribose transport system ATP-binding protein
MVAIARALHLSTHLVIMDEPTTMLGQSEVAQLFSVIRKLRSQGISILYVTHRLEEAMQIGDRATVLRDGKCIVTMPINETTRTDLISLIIGRAVEEQYSRPHPAVGAELMRIEAMSSSNGIQDVSLTLHKGEILGIAGLVGAGGTSLLRAIFGADPVTVGDIFIEQNPVKINHPQDAISLGMGMLTEDRQEQGLILEMKALENISLSSLDNLSSGPFIDLEAESNVVRHYAQKLNIHAADLPRQVQHLSGGTQQKVILSRWLANQCHILLLDEPTRGIDVGARIEFYHLLNDLSRRGVGMIIVSSNLQEIISLADRVMVIRQGRLVGEFDTLTTNPTEILSLASTGGSA